MSIGSIFAIMKKEDDSIPTINDALQPGNTVVAAGYALYGSATMMVLSLGGSVNGFMLDPSIGEFILIDKDMRVPSKGRILIRVLLHLIYFYLVFRKYLLDKRGLY